MSASKPPVDCKTALPNVRFTPESGHVRRNLGCPPQLGMSAKGQKRTFRKGPCKQKDRLAAVFLLRKFRRSGIELAKSHNAVAAINKTETDVSS
jgi:hypothetical protein